MAVGQAWVAGAQKLSTAQRTAFANDPLNLLAVDAPANRQKGDREASAWLPKNKAFRCACVATQIAVKKKYALPVTTAEKAAMKRVLASCAKQRTVTVTPINPAGSKTSSAPAKSSSGSSLKVSPRVLCLVHEGQEGHRQDQRPDLHLQETSATDSRLRWRAA